MSDPKPEHREAALRVVRYLKNSPGQDILKIAQFIVFENSPGQGILLKASTSLSLTAWCDSDWASCSITNDSLTGWFIQLRDSPISWKTKKHDVVSRSLVEVKYTVQEIL